jgi:hypothetical protein
MRAWLQGAALVKQAFAVAWQHFNLYGRNDASGGVKIAEIGRFENRCIRGRIPAKRRCASAWFQKKNGGRRYFDGSRVKKMAVPRRFSNRLIYTILKSPLAVIV